jgi:hypothetical protein
MKSLSKSQPVGLGEALPDFQDKQSLCTFIANLQAQVNEVALALSTAEGSELHEVWVNLANARAYLTTALEVAQHVKPNHHHHNYHI